MTADPENPFAGQGAVVLDIGGDIGALVVTMPAGMSGVEVEIRPVGVASGHAGGAGHVHDHVHDHDQDHDHAHGHEGEHLQHVAVVDRPVAEGHVPSLVFPELRAGAYDLFEKGRPDDVALTAQIVGGEVTECAWPS